MNNLIFSFATEEKDFELFKSRLNPNSNMYMYLYLALAEKVNFPYKQQFVKMMFTKILGLRNGKFHRVWCLISALILSTSVVRNYLAEPVVLFI